MKSLTIIFVLLHTLAIGQVATIREIKKEPGADSLTFRNYKITYPVVVTKFKAADEKINFQIKKILLEPDSAIVDKRVAQILDTAIKYGLVFMSYKITFNRNSILSLSVDAYSCGGNCSDWQRHFNFNVRTGDVITAADIFKSDSYKIFKDSVFTRKVRELTDYKSKLKADFGNKDLETYNWAIETIDPCVNSISLEQFSLSDSEIEIFDRCWFPHAMMELEPFYRLNYSYSSISDLLKPEWKKILMK